MVPQGRGVRYVRRAPSSRDDTVLVGHPPWSARACLDVILSLLQRQDVRDIAGKAGLSIDQARAGISLLQGTDLAQAAEQARVVQDSLAGGGNVTVSTTTIIIVLLLLILILVIAK